MVLAVGIVDRLAAALALVAEIADKQFFVSAVVVEIPDRLAVRVSPVLLDWQQRGKAC